MDIGAPGSISALLASTVKSAYSQNKTVEIQESSNQIDNNTSSDYLTISDEGQNLLSLTTMFGTAPGESISIDDIKSFADNQLKEFNGELKALLRENNIDTSVPITLGHENGTGKVIVTSNHPDAEKIEKLLNNNFELRNQYTSITNAMNLAKNAEEYSKFSDAYANNPRSAVAQYSYLFNMQWDTEITFDDEGYNISYNQTAKS